MKKLVITIVSLILSLYKCEIHRGNFERFAYFVRGFSIGFALNVTALETHHGITTSNGCVQFCIRHFSCVSINYNRIEFVCELLSEDRRSASQENVIERPNYVYMDTQVDFDACGIRNDCFPCKCTPVNMDPNGNDCNCLMFPSHLTKQINSGAVIQAIIHPENLNIYAQNGIHIYKHDNNPVVGGSNWYVYLYLGSISKLYIDFFNEKYNVFGLVSNKIYHDSFGNWQIFGEQSQHYTAFTVQPDYLLAIDGVGDLFKITDGISTLYVKGPIRAVQKHREYLYAIGSDCKCIVRHDVVESLESFSWDLITSAPGSCVQFKVNFNDIIYARFENKYIYEWDDRKKIWLNLNIGPCLDFDVKHFIVCVPLSEKVVSNWHTLPRPNINIPFKLYNNFDFTTPFTIGQDFDGKKTMQLGSYDAACGRVVSDQFGKGNVLHTFTGEMCGFGNFDGTVIANQKEYERQYTIAAWFRLTSRSFQHSILTLFSTLNGLSIHIKHDNVHCSVYFQVNTTSHELNNFGQTMDIPIEKFYYWTLVSFRTRSITALLGQLFINGTVYSTVTVATKKELEATNQTTVGTLFTQCVGCYVSDLSIWYTILSLAQFLQLYHQETVFKSCYLLQVTERVSAPCSDPNSCVDDSIVNALNCFANSKKDDLAPPVLTSEKTRVTAKSCRALLEQNPAMTGLGYYWINLDGKMKTVLCDMSVDGGGWTLAAGVSHDVVGTKLFSDFKTEDHLSIDAAFTGNTALTASAFLTLQQLMNFRQLRFHCSSGLHSRVVDIATKSPEMLDFLFRPGSPVPVPCKTYYRLPADTSEQFEDCEKVNYLFESSSGDTKIYGTLGGAKRTMYGPNAQFLCDGLPGDEASGTFRIYVK